MLEEVWDKVVEEFDYIVSGEIFGDVGEFFSNFFEGLGELSFVGMLYGVILVILVFLFRKQVFVLIDNIFLKILFYIVAFFMGYMMGRKIWE